MSNRDMKMWIRHAFPSMNHTRKGEWCDDWVYAIGVTDIPDYNQGLEIEERPILRLFRETDGRFSLSVYDEYGEEKDRIEVNEEDFLPMDEIYRALGM